MNNPFKKSNSNTVVVIEEQKQITPTVNEIIEEIHDTFYTEVDRLLASAHIANSLDTNKQELINKHERLKSLGFTSTKEVKEAEVEIKRLENLKLENEQKKTLIEAINYFAFKYPNYKFITEDSVKKICSKYNLVYGTIDKYTGTVPDKNLKHIEDFKVVEDDECFIHQIRHLSLYSSDYLSKEYRTLEQHKLDKQTEEYNSENNYFNHYFSEKNIKHPLEIAAPQKDFNMNGMEVKDHRISKIEIPDPIVLKPIIFSGTKHYLIVTAWGVESSDGLVVNQKLN